MLAADSGIDLAFVQGGLAGGVETGAVMAIGSLYLEPLWLFVRGDFDYKLRRDIDLVRRQLRDSNASATESSMDGQE